MSSKKLIKQLEGQLWYPAIGWQVLRRSKRYQVAFNELVAEATKVEGEDGPTGYAIAFASLAEDEVPEIQNDRTLNAEKMGNAPLRVRVHDVGIENVLFDDAEIDPPRFDDLMYTHYCQNFLKKFGFAVRFPIEPTQSKPNRSFLESLWCMYPAAEYSSKDLNRLLMQFAQEHERFQSLNLLIDFNFSDEAIKRNVSGIVDEVLSRRKKNAVFGDKKPISTEFDEALKTFDLFHSGEKRTWNQLANELWPQGSPLGGRPEDLARSRVESIENLITIFDNEAASRIDA